jgi:2-hydroxy-6-oxonona-2,4-dienedioate hydrolase
MVRHDPDRYRAAERRLIEHHGIEVHEHVVPAGAAGGAVRVLETGSGPATLFVHGSPNAAATWLGLAAQLPGRRCLMLERPGAGLSEPVTWTDHRAQTAQIQAAVLDHLGVDEVDAVGSSFGGLYVLNLAHACPERVRRVLLVGAPGGLASLPYPAVIRGLSLPIPGFVLARALKPDADGAREMFEQIGHGESVRSGAIAPVEFEWYSALLRHTDTLPSLAREVRAIATPLGYRAGASWTNRQLAGLVTPIDLLWGDRDPFATPAQADALAAAIGARVTHHPSMGHLPWFDDPARIADEVEATFMVAPREGAGAPRPVSRPSAGAADFLTEPGFVRQDGSRAR